MHFLTINYSLGLDEDSISVLGLEQTGQPWVNVLLQYRRAAIDPHGNAQMPLFISITDSSLSWIRISVMVTYLCHGYVSLYMQ